MNPPGHACVYVEALAVPAVRLVACRRNRIKRTERRKVIENIVHSLAVESYGAVAPYSEHQIRCIGIRRRGLFRCDCPVRMVPTVIGIDIELYPLAYGLLKAETHLSPLISRIDYDSVLRRVGGRSKILRGFGTAADRDIMTVYDCRPEQHLLPVYRLDIAVIFKRHTLLLEIRGRRLGRQFDHILDVVIRAHHVQHLGDLLHTDISGIGDLCLADFAAVRFDYDNAVGTAGAIIAVAEASFNILMEATSAGSTAIEEKSSVGKPSMT